MTPQQFIQSVTAVSFENTFNPYVQRCPVHDLEDAPQRRKAVLLSILKVAAKSEVDAVWIGRDLGYRGGRRTGLALTDDVSMAAHAARWGIRITRPTTGQAVAERTAAVIWNVLSQINSRVFLWNVFPLHPHEQNLPFTNRAHNTRERRAGEELLEALVSLLRPLRVIAIGNDAGNTARRVCDRFEVIQVRHPSYGGQTEFLASMRELYAVREDNRRPRLF